MRPNISDFNSFVAMEALKRRITNLNGAKDKYDEELLAVREQFIAQMELMDGRLEAIEARLISKMNSGVGEKLDYFHQKLMDIQLSELNGT